MKKWNEQRRQQALAAGSISVNGFIELGKELEGTCKNIKAYDMALNVPQEKTMVFYKTDNKNLLQNPHSELRLKKDENAPKCGTRIKVRVVYVFTSGESIVELVS